MSSWSAADELESRSWDLRLKCWRDEAQKLGERLHEARYDEEVQYVSTRVRHLRARIRIACDELRIPVCGDESIDQLVRKILRALS